MLVEPRPTAYDIHFSALGFRVRLSPYFFLLTVLLGYNNAMSDNLLSPGAHLAIWVAVCFVSILVHELGHSLMMRRYRIPSRIVLYHFGGLAIPEGSSFGARIGPVQQMAISVAGPAIQLLLAATIVLLLSVGGYEIPTARSGLMSYLIPSQLSGDKVLPPAVMLTIFLALYVNVYWALLNLVPIYPLDGGQISREMFFYLKVPDAVRKSLMVSVAASIMLVVWALTEERMYMAIMFGMLGFQSFTTLQNYNSHGGGRW